MENPPLPFCPFLGFFPKRLLQSQKDPDSRRHPERPWRGWGGGFWEAIQAREPEIPEPGFLQFAQDNSPGLKESPQWTRQGVGIAFIYLPSMGSLGGETKVREGGHWPEAQTLNSPEISA